MRMLFQANNTVLSVSAVLRHGKTNHALKTAITERFVRLYQSSGMVPGVPLTLSIPRRDMRRRYVEMTTKQGAPKHVVDALEKSPVVNGGLQPGFFRFDRILCAAHAFMEQNPIVKHIDKPVYLIWRVASMKAHSYPLTWHCRRNNRSNHELCVLTVLCKTACMWCQ